MTRRAHLLAVITIVSALAAGVPLLAAPGPRYLDDATFLEMEDVRDPAISPDGGDVVFTRRRVDQTNDRFHSNLWVSGVDGTRVRELTHGDWSDSDPVFSPDGSRLAFLSDRDGSQQIHVMWLDTREVAQLTHLERSPRDLAWSPDGKKLAFTLFVPDREDPLAIKLPKGVVRQVPDGSRGGRRRARGETDTGRAGRVAALKKDRR